MKETCPTEEDKYTTKIPTTKFVPMSISAYNFDVKFYSDEGPNKGNTDNRNNTNQYSNKNRRIPTLHEYPIQWQ
jgi:hypothetical protein